MKAWWKTKAWPWLKEKWWAVLVGLALVWALIVKRKVTVVDPVANADQRAALENTRRREEVQRLEHQLAEERGELEDVATADRAEAEAEAQSDVQELRDNPDELTRRMQEVGKK